LHVASFQKHDQGEGSERECRLREGGRTKGGPREVIESLENKNLKESCTLVVFRSITNGEGGCGLRGRNNNDSLVNPMEEEERTKESLDGPRRRSIWKCGH
jgi:hypothetical protein